MPLVRYEIQSELALANRDLYRTAPKNDPQAILEGVAMVGLVGIVRQLGDLAEFAADVFHDLHEALLATASRSHDLVSRVSHLEGELGAVEKSMFSKKTNHLQFAYAPGVDWRATVPTDQNFCTQGDLPRFIRSAYEACRGPPKLFLLDKFDVQGAGACLKRYTDPSFFKMEWASSEIMKAEKAQQQKKARRGKKRARGRKDSDGNDVKPAVQFQPRLRRTSSKSSVEDASESIMAVKSIPLNKTEGHSHQSSSETSAATKSPKSVRRFGFPKPLPPVTNNELKTKPVFSRELEEDAARGSSDVEQYLDAMTNMESETDSEPLERRRFYDGFKRTGTAQRKSDHDGDVFFEDARNSTMESETESKYSVELSPIPVDSHLEFEDGALDSIERTESQQHEGELDESSSWRKGVGLQKMDQYLQASHLTETNGQEISQSTASKADNDLEQPGSVHAEAGKSTGGPTNQLLEGSNLEARMESLHNELMDVEEAEDAEEADDEEQFDVELLRVIGYSAAEAQDTQKPDPTGSEADRNLEQQTAKAPLTPEVEVSKDAENVGLDPPDSAGLRMEVADNRALEGSSVMRTEAELGNPSTDDSDGTKLHAAEKYFSLDSNFEGGELLRQETPQKQTSGASSTSGTSTSLHEAVLVEEKLEENVPLVDDFESSSSEDVFMDADAGYQSSSRFSDADYNFGDASSEQFEQMESLSGRELPSSMQITPDNDDDSAANQHVYYGGHDTEERVFETSEAVFEKQPWEQATEEALLEQQQTETIAEESVLEQQLDDQEALLKRPAQQIAEERCEEAKEPAEQRIEGAVLGQESAETFAEQRTKGAPITLKQIADPDISSVPSAQPVSPTNKKPTMAAGPVAEQISKKAIAEQQGTVEPVIEDQPALQHRSEEAAIEPQLQEQILEQGLKDVPQLEDQVLRQGVKQTEFPAKDLSSPVSSTGSPVLAFCPETGSEDAIAFKLGTLSPLSPPDMSSESSSSPSSSSSSSPRSPVFSALRAPLSPTRRAGDDERANIETFLAPSSPTSTSELPSYPPPESRDMPPLPPLPPVRWLTSQPSRDAQLSRASPSLSTPTLVETTKQADEAHVPMQQAGASRQQTRAVEDEMLVDVSLQHADSPKLVPVHSRELDVGATAQQPPSSDEEDDDIPELEIPQALPELEIPEAYQMRTPLEVPHPPQRTLLQTSVAERQEAEIRFSKEATEVPGQKPSHLEIQEAAREALQESEIPSAEVLEDELEVTSAPAEEATGIPEQKASHLEIQEAARETLQESEVSAEPAAAVLENELEVTSAPAEEATGVPEQKPSHLEIQEAAKETLQEPEVPAEPAAAVLENEQEVTSVPAEEATGVPEQKSSHPEIQQAAREALQQPEVPAEPALENELEVTATPADEATGVPKQKASHLEIQKAAREASPEHKVSGEPAAAVFENEQEVTSVPVEEATGVLEQKSSHPEIQQAAREALQQPEVPAEPAGSVLENELEVTATPADEATGVPKQKASHLEIQKAAREASPEHKVSGEPAPAVLENEFEVTSTPLQEQEPGFSAAEKEMIQQALNEDHSGLWRMAMQLEYDALKMKMEITETSQQTVEPTVAGSLEVEEVVELETELETSAKELEPEILETNAEVRREIGQAETQETTEAKDFAASELSAAGGISNSGEQVVLKQVALEETDPGEVIVPADSEELHRLETLELVGKPEVVNEDELAAKQPLDTDSKQSPVVESKDHVVVPETPETEDGSKTQLSRPADDAPLVVFPEAGAVLEPTGELHDTLPVSTMPLKKETSDDPLIKAISQHDRSKLKKVASDLRPPSKAPDERDVLLEQIRSQSFNLRQTVPEKEKPEVRQQPRILSNINVAAILEKANAIRQAFVGSDDDEDDDWSDS